MGRLAEPEPEKTEAEKLVDLFETKGAPGSGWTPEDYALLASFQPEKAPSNEGAGSGGPAAGPQQNAGNEDDEEGSGQAVTVATDGGTTTTSTGEEDFTEEELAEAQEILDALFGMGMPDPTTWTPERVGVPTQGPRLRPAGQGGTDGDGEGESGSGGEDQDYLSWEDRQRAAQREWLQNNGYILPLPQIFTSSSTPTANPETTETTSVDYIVPSGGSVLGIASDYGVSLENLLSANPQLADRLQGYDIVDVAYNPGEEYQQIAQGLLRAGEHVTLPLGLVNDFEASAGIEQLIKGFESPQPYPDPYDDPADNCAVGYGHKIHDGPCDNRLEEQAFQGITPEYAQDLFVQDVSDTEQGIKALVNVELNQNQFDALVSFAYNIGVGRFLESPVLDQLNAGNLESAAEETLTYVYDNNGQYQEGLNNRRQAEVNWFYGGQDE